MWPRRKQLEATSQPHHCNVVFDQLLVYCGVCAAVQSAIWATHGNAAESTCSILFSSLTVECNADCKKVLFEQRQAHSPAMSHTLHWNGPNWKYDRANGIGQNRSYFEVALVGSLLIAHCILPKLAPLEMLIMIAPEEEKTSLAAMAQWVIWVETVTRSPLLRYLYSVIHYNTFQCNVMC